MYVVAIAVGCMCNMQNMTFTSYEFHLPCFGSMIYNEAINLIATSGHHQ